MLSKLDSPEEFKNDTYVKEVSQEIITLALSEHTDTHKTDRQYWDVYEGKRDETKFQYLTTVNTGTTNLTYPAKMRNIGNKIARSKLNLLESKQARRIFRFKTVAIDERTLQKKYENRVKAHVKAVKEMYAERSDAFRVQIDQVNDKMREMQEMVQAQPENEQMALQQQQLMANMPMIQVELNRMIRYLSKEKLDSDELQRKIDKFVLSSDTEIMQQISTASLKSAIDKEDLSEHWNIGFREKLVTGRPMYITYYNERIKDVIFKQIDAINCYYSSGGNNKWTNNGEWCAVEEIMTIAQIKSEFELSDEQAQLLSTYEVRQAGTIRNYYNNTAVFDGNSTSVQNYEGISVWRIWFLSPRHIYYKSSPNKYREGESFYNLTSKEAKLKPNEKKHKVTIYDCYASVYIGNDMCINLKKQDKMFRPLDMPGLPSLPLVGRSFNAISEKPYSLIASIKELIDLYDIVNYKKELTICLAGIKGMIMDKSQKPDNMNTKTWLYYRKMGTMYIETIKKGRKVQSSYNQFTDYDDSLTDSIILFDNILANIEFVMSKIMGITDAAIGQFVKDDAVSNVRMSQEQSSLITEILFHENDKVFTKALDLFLNLKTRYVWNNGKVLNYMNKDLEEVLIHIPKGMLNGSDYRIYTNNNIRQDEQLEDLRQVAIQSWAKGEIPIPSIASIIVNEDVKDLENSLIMLHKEAQEIQQQNMLAVENKKGEIEERKLQLQLKIDQQIETIKGATEEAKLEIERQKLAFEQSKFDWETKYKEKELQVNAETEAFKTASENEIETAYLNEEGRANRVQEQLKQFELRINAILTEAGILSSEHQAKMKSTVDLKNMRNKENIKD